MPFPGHQDAYPEVRSHHQGQATWVVLPTPTQDRSNASPESDRLEIADASLSESFIRAQANTSAEEGPSPEAP